MFFKTELFEHQKKCVEKLKGIRIGALYMEMGTGKTRTALELIKLRLDKGKINHVIWLCPFSVKENLRRDIIFHTGSEQKDLITICGIETLSSSIKENVRLLNLVQEKSCFIIVDESNLIKNPRAKRTENITRLGEYCKYRLILNGTPITRTESDLYSQWYFLDWRVLGYKSFWSFAANHLEYDETGKRIIRSLNTDYLTKKIAPYSYQVKKDECLGLPEKTYEKVYCELTEEQMEHYELIADELLFEVDEMKPHTIYKLFTGLQNVISGFRVINGEKHLSKTLFFDKPEDNPRIQLLMDLISKIDEKVIIFCKYTQEINDIVKLINKAYGENTAVPFFGELSQKKRQKCLDMFRDKSQFLVANKSCAGYGLNLQFCAYLIYYSNDWDYATRIQSEDRVHRLGQNRNVHIIDICASDTLDERILDCLERKENLVDSFKQELEEMKDKDELISWIDKRDYRGRRYAKKIKSLDKSNLIEEEFKLVEAYFTKNIKNKFDYIREVIKNVKHSNVIYFCPKKYKDLAEENLEGVYIFHYEDINKSNEPQNLTNEETLLILDGSARYKNITSYIFKRLEKIALIPKNKLVVDIVPFTTDIMYSYIPFSHLKRAILGHQHWYAFRENNMEYNSKGELVEGHDFNLLAEKMAPVTKIDYPHFMECKYNTIYCDLTEDEQKEYEKYRDELFEKYDSIQPVLTRLADFTNTRKSRYENLYKLVKGLRGKTIVYTNIKSHNSAIKKLLKNFKNVEVRTFYDNNDKEQNAMNIVLAEVPIVKNYLFLDVIANASNANFYFITGNTTIDKFLYEKMFNEFTQIDEFTKILYEKVNKNG